MWVWGENNGIVRNWGTLLGSEHFGSRGACWSSGMEPGRLKSNLLLTWTCINQTTSWLLHSWNMFGARKSHRQTRTHKTHHGLDLGETTTFPLIVYYVPGHGISTQMTFCHGIPKWESRNSQSWDSRNFGLSKVAGIPTLGAHNFVYRHPIEMCSEKSCSPC